MADVAGDTNVDDALRLARQPDVFSNLGSNLAQGATTSANQALDYLKTHNARQSWSDLYNWTTTKGADMVGKTAQEFANDPYYGLGFLAKNSPAYLAAQTPALLAEQNQTVNELKKQGNGKEAGLAAAAMIPLIAGALPEFPEGRAISKVAPLETDANRIAMGLTNPVYHGGREPWTVFDPEKLSDRTLSTKLGIHLAPDPEIAGANPFTHPHEDWGGPGGNVKPLYTYPDEKFYEIPQPIDPRSTSSEHVPMWKRVILDDDAVGADIKRVVYAKNPDLLAQHLNDVGVHHTEMHQAAQDLLANKPVEYKTVFGAKRGFENFEDYLNQTGAAIPDNDAHRDLLLKEYQRELKKRGYAGIKYINTFAEEVANASDPTSYILFPNNPKLGEPFPLRSKFAKFTPFMAESRDIGHASGGEVNNALHLARHLMGKSHG